MAQGLPNLSVFGGPGHERRNTSTNGHLSELFEDAPKAFIQKVEQRVRLIRSNGVGVYFVSQTPTDIPDDVLGQLGNGTQHALRAFTPLDRKTMRATTSTFRQNPAFDAEQVITELGVGEALVSTLGIKGVPSIVDRTLIRPFPLTSVPRRRRSAVPSSIRASVRESMNSWRIRIPAYEKTAAAGGAGCMGSRAGRE